MPITIQDPDLEKDKEKNIPTSPTNQPAQAGQASAVSQSPLESSQATSSVAQGVPRAGTGPNTAKQGTGFVNLAKVLQANRNNQLGQAIGSGITQSAQQAKSNIGQAQTQFQQQAETGRADTEQAKQRKDFIFNKALNDPSNLSDTEVQEFQKYKSASYGGPTELANIGQLQNTAQDVEALGKNIQSAAGRQTLLQKYAAGSKGYNPGQQKLDTLLLGQTGAAPLQQARRQTLGLTGQVGATQKAAQDLAAQYAQQATQFGQETSQQLGTEKPGQGFLGTLTQQISEKVAQENAAREQLKKEIQDVQKDPSKGISSNLIKALGGLKIIKPVTDIEGGYGPGGFVDLNLDILKGLQAGNTVSAADVATPLEIAQYQALNKLAGGAGGFIGSNKVAGGRILGGQGISIIPGGSLGRIKVI